jgi:hypothetical protein
MKNNIFSRRDFLKLILTSIGAFLASCAPAITETSTLSFAATSSSTPEPTATQTPTATATSTPTETPTPTEVPCFNLLTPENGAKLNPIGKVTFSWEGISNAASYKLEITLPNGQIISFDATGIRREQYIEAIQMGGTFQWRVIAFDSSGAVICEAKTFTFEKPQYIPLAPTKAPGNNDNGSGSDSGNGSDCSLWHPGCPIDTTPDVGNG